MKLTGITIGLTILSITIAGSSAYTIDSTEVAVVTEFGAPIAVRTEPGLYFRAPWPIHQVERFDSRSKLLNIEAKEQLTQDGINIVVEPYVVWKISNPQIFLESVGTTETAEARLKDLVVDSVGKGLGRRQYDDLLEVQTTGSVEFMPTGVLTEVQSIAAERFGVEILDLRIHHIGLPVQNEQSIYEQMRADRIQEASEYRAKGEEQAAGTRAKADLEAAKTLADAEITAGNTRAETEEAVARKWVEAYQKDPQFYRFLRQLELYETVVDEQTILVLESEGLESNGAPPVFDDLLPSMPVVSPSTKPHLPPAKSSP